MAEQVRRMQEQQQLFMAIERCVQRAEELEADNKLTEAINLVQAGALRCGLICTVWVCICRWGWHMLCGAAPTDGALATELGGTGARR